MSGRFVRASKYREYPHQSTRATTGPPLSADCSWLTFTCGDLVQDTSSASLLERTTAMTTCASVGTPGTRIWSRLARSRRVHDARATANSLALLTGQPRVPFGQLGVWRRRRVCGHTPEREGKAARPNTTLPRPHRRSFGYRLVREPPPSSRVGTRLAPRRLGRVSPLLV